VRLPWNRGVKYAQMVQGQPAPGGRVASPPAAEGRIAAAQGDALAASAPPGQDVLTPKRLPTKICDKTMTAGYMMGTGLTPDTLDTCTSV
jgi:hypothetical protein